MLTAIIVSEKCKRVSQAAKGVPRAGSIELTHMLLSKHLRVETCEGEG